MEIHEIFYASFPSELYEWITKLADNQGRCRLEKLIVWTPELVRSLEASGDKIMRVVDHWLSKIIGGFITEFIIETSISYSETKWCFLKGPQGKYIKSLKTLIKILLCENQVMWINWSLGLHKVGGSIETKVA